LHFKVRKRPAFWVFLVRALICLRRPESRFVSQLGRRSFLKAAAAGFLSRALLNAQQSAPPNIIFILADDLGYGDLGCYGSKIPTPNLDAMASEGARFTQFYSANPVCSPSRASLLTGRYPTRVGVTCALAPTADFGLPDSETTIAQMLRLQGYSTMCVGKWHLGSKPQYLPTNRGFDEFYGLPYSNDMDPLPLMHNTDVIAERADQDHLTQQYTEQAVQFISRSKKGPFFLYFAHTAPHIPLAASERFRGKTGLGLYSDSVAELDWSVGEVLRALKDNGIDNNTLVMFSSDNGPWYQGSAGNLRGRKGMTYEGGVREPLIARFPGRIPAGRVVSGVASMMDVLPTVSRLCAAPMPDNPVDGVNIWPLLTGDRESVDRDILLYFDDWHVQCARMGKWKLHVARYNSPAFAPVPSYGRLNLPLNPPELYDIEADPEESYDCASDYPQVVADIRSRIESSLYSFPDAVRSSWRNTMNAKTYGIPAGAYPLPNQP
jgi:arylsulfatase A